MTGRDSSSTPRTRRRALSGLRISTVRGRIVWTTALVTVLAMALMAFAVIVIVARTTTGRIDASLKDRIAATESTLRPAGGGGRLRLAGTGKDTVVDSIWVFDPDGTLVSGPRAGEHVEDIVDGLAHVTHPTRIERRQRVYYAVPIALPGHTTPSGVAVASEDIDPYQDAQDRLIAGLVTLGVLMTALTATFSAWTVRRTLKPVDQMADLADLWSEHDLDARFDLGGRSDELSRLGSTLDGLLERVAATIRSEQQLTSELAHELRTPLTTIRAEAELGLMGDLDPPARERLQRIVEQVDRLTSTIRALVTVARHQHRGRHRCDLEAVLGGLVASHTSTIDVAVDESPSGIEVAADAALVERVVAPVLDNAVRYSTTRVWVDLHREGHSAVVDVCDDGPGIGETEAIFTPGAAGPDSPGAGLGLPLARRVVTSLGGAIQVTHDSDPTVVQIRLPAR